MESLAIAPQTGRMFRRNHQIDETLCIFWPKPSKTFSGKVDSALQLQWEILWRGKGSEILAQTTFCSVVLRVFAGNLPGISFRNTVNCVFLWNPDYIPLISLFEESTVFKLEYKVGNRKEMERTWKGNEIKLHLKRGKLQVDVLRNLAKELGYVWKVYIKEDWKGIDWMELGWGNYLAVFRVHRPSLFSV